MTESLGFRESMKEANIKSKLDKTEKLTGITSY